MKKYSKYKASGVEWFNEIPNSWGLEKIKFQGRVVSGSTPETSKPEFWEGEIVWATPVDFGADNQMYIYTSGRKITNEGLKNIGGKLIPKGAVVISSRAPIGLVALAGVDLVTNQGCKSVIPKKVVGEFLFFCLKEFSTVLENLGNETVFSELSLGTLKNFYLPIPPLSEQHAIVRFLDYKTGQIDSFIANRQKQIELLKEQKACIINNAVTKGINPNAKMKDSGIEWIGEVPESWIVSKIKFAGKIINGYAFDSKDFKDSGIRVVKISNIQTRNIDWSEESFVEPFLFDKLENFRIKKDDLVFALTRPIISTGIKAAIIETNEPMLINQRNAVFRPKSIDKKFLYHIIFNEDFIQYFESLIDNTGQQPNISSEDIANIKIPLPPLEEQTEVVKYLDEHCGEIDTLISKYQKQIDLMQEYRTSLISQAVTGKIDVREWHPKKAVTA